MRDFFSNCCFLFRGISGCIFWGLAYNLKQRGRISCFDLLIFSLHVFFISAERFTFPIGVHHWVGFKDSLLASTDISIC